MFCGLITKFMVLIMNLMTSKPATRELKSDCQQQNYERPNCPRGLSGGANRAGASISDGICAEIRVPVEIRL